MATATQNRLSGRRVTINVQKNVKPEQVNAALAELYKLSGCLSCGFLGWDLVIRGGDPEIAALQSLRDIGGVTVDQIGAAEHFGG
jgi:hypothetical protein